ncbi:hypothetical protein FACS1894111_11710 [Clostridia bacterium]|nr:hypothetical protein FACS1894111_11710 [Clostridia bacterium]
MQAELKSFSNAQKNICKYLSSHRNETITDADIEQFLAKQGIERHLVWSLLKEYLFNPLLFTHVRNSFVHIRPQRKKCIRHHQHK